MAFPYIDTSRPLGTQMVSTIDDAERETRTWLEQCMESISGYPTVETVKVAGWTTSTRPTLDGSGYLVGYNATEDQLELIGEGGVLSVMTDKQDIRKQIALLAHPVGEYYWTSNASFNPNTAWGGTWERIQDGRVLISDTIDGYEVGDTGGTTVETLTTDQIPRHEHSHTHTRGTMEITGTFGAAIDNGNSWSGAFYKIKQLPRMNDQDGNHWETGFEASRSWTGETSEDSTQTGGGQAHNNMQPYRVAICWHRTA